VLVTFVILRVLGLFMKLRAPDEALEVGDIAVHDEEAYPDEILVGGRTSSEFSPVARHAEIAEGSRVEAD